MAQQSIDEFVRARIKEYMALESLTLYAVALACDLSKATVSNYLTGKTSPSLQFVEAFCRLVCITQAEFYRPYDDLEGYMEEYKVDPYLSPKTAQKVQELQRRRKRLFQKMYAEVEKQIDVLN